MTVLDAWLSKRVLIACALIGCLAIAAFILAGAKLGQATESEFSSYSVTIEHFGVDSREIERSITIPLENELGAIAGLREIRSTSEYGKSRVTVSTEAGADLSSVYLQIRDAADRVYRGLPSSAQKPQISSSGSSQRPVFAVSIRAAGISEESLRELVDKEIKSAFEKVDGVGEVEVGGGRTKEVHVLVDQRRAAVRRTSVASLAEQIQRQDIIGPVGTLREGALEFPVSVRGRISTLEALSAQPLHATDGSFRLSDVASAVYGYREPDSISRVDGEKMMVLYAQSSGSANLVSLSRALRAEAKRWNGEGVNMDVILDSGRSLEKALLEIVEAMGEGILAVLIVLPLIVPGFRRIASLSVAIALVPILSAAVLAALGLGIDQYVLSGLAVGLGTVVDNGAVVVGLQKRRSLSPLVPSLRTSLVTTLIVLVPLFFLDFVAPGIRQISLSLAVLFIVAFIGTVLVLPAFAVPADDEMNATAISPRKRSRFRSLTRPLIKRLMAMVTTSAGHPVPFLVVAVLVVAALSTAIFLMGSDFSPDIEEDSLYAQIEFESGISVDAVDARTAAFAAQIRLIPGVIMVESISRPGSAELMLKIDPRIVDRAKLASEVKKYSEGIPGGFVYFPEGGKSDRSYEVAVLGEDDELLRSIATEAARRLGEEGWIDQVVLNFKEPPRALTLALDHKKMAVMGLSAAEIAGSLRWTLYGPVAVKWIERDREFDLRVFDADAKMLTRDDLMAMPIVSRTGGVVRLSGVADLREEAEGAKIYRKNRQRAAFFTVHANSGSVEKTVIGIKDVLSKMDLPPGYAFDMDRAVLELKESFSTLWLMLALAVFLIYVILASSTESLLCPFLILSILPTSLAFPIVAYFIAGIPLRIPALVGLIMLSGMAVNNSILIANEVRTAGGRWGVTASRMRGIVVTAIRKRLQPLLISSGMTIIGTMPLLFAGGSGGDFMRTISFVVFWGVFGSLASTFLFLPAIAVRYPGAFISPSFSTAERSPS